MAMYKKTFLGCFGPVHVTFQGLFSLLNFGEKKRIVLVKKKHPQRKRILLSQADTVQVGFGKSLVGFWKLQVVRFQPLGTPSPHSSVVATPEVSNLSTVQEAEVEKRRRPGIYERENGLEDLWKHT